MPDAQSRPNSASPRRRPPVGRQPQRTAGIAAHGSFATRPCRGWRFCSTKPFAFPAPAFRFGLDGIIGLVPGLGDVLAGLLSLDHSARRMDSRRSLRHAGAHGRESRHRCAGGLHSHLWRHLRHRLEGEPPQLSAASAATWASRGGTPGATGHFCCCSLAAPGAGLCRSRRRLWSGSSPGSSAAECRARRSRGQRKPIRDTIEKDVGA